MKRIITILTILFVSIFAQASEEAQTDVPASTESVLVVEVHGMVCAFCAQGIDKKLGKLDAVEEVFINLEENVVAVTETEGASVSDEEMKRIITDAGFSVTSLKRKPGTLSDLEASLEK